MYREHFKLASRPFSLTPDPAFLYLSSTHREALGHLLFGLRNRTGFIAVVGEVGTGKTTLLRSLLSQLPESEYRTAFIFNPRISSLELLRSITRELGIDMAGGGRDELLDALNRSLLDENAAGRTVVLVIDEAQNLGSSALEEVRLLSNLETETDKLLQIVLVGQPELAKILETRKLRQLRQRISVFYRLNPLSYRECLDYARHRIEVAGGDPERLFARSALQRACRDCRGIPRRLNILLDRALLIAFAGDRRQVQATHLRQARRELRAPLGEASRGTVWRWGAALLALAAVLGGGVFYSRIPRPAMPPVSSAAPPPGVSIHPLVLKLADLTSQTSRNEALASLFERWSVAPLDVATSAPIEQAIHSRGLSLFRFEGSLDELLNHNTPALLSFQLPGVDGRRYLALLARDGADFIVSPSTAGGAPLDLEQLRSFWTGEALLVWRNPIGHSQIANFGDRGPDIAEIQKRLLGAGYFSGVFDGIFEKETLNAVRSFQRDMGLPVDGRVGPRTMMLLSQAGGMDDVVTLRSAKESS